VRDAEPALSESGKHSSCLPRDAALVEHVKASGAKNPEDTVSSLSEEEFDTLTDLLEVKDLHAVLKSCGVKLKSAGKIVQYCELFGYVQKLLPF
jgi:hypothetical protein